VFLRASLSVLSMLSVVLWWLLQGLWNSESFPAGLRLFVDSPFVGARIRGIDQPLKAELVLYGCAQYVCV